MDFRFPGCAKTVFASFSVIPAKQTV